MITDLKDDDTPGAHRDFSRAFQKCWGALEYAQIKFLNTVFKYAGKWQRASVHKRQLVRRRLDDITAAIRRCDTFVAKPGGKNRSDRDENEQDILALFLSQRAIPFVEFWQEAIGALDDDASLQIEWRDISVWFDEDQGQPRIERISGRRQEAIFVVTIEGPNEVPVIKDGPCDVAAFGQAVTR